MGAKGGRVGASAVPRGAHAAHGPTGEQNRVERHLGNGRTAARIAGVLFMEYIFGAAVMFLFPSQSETSEEGSQAAQVVRNVAKRSEHRSSPNAT